MMRSTLIAALVASLLSLAACGGAPAGATSPANEVGKTAPATSNVKEPGEAKIGDTTKCPVSGEEFVVDASSPKVEHAGKTYYMCCGGCKKKFEADPAKYLKKS